MGVCKFEARDCELSADTASADDNLFSLKAQPAFSFDGVFVGETRYAGVFVDGHAQRIDLRAEGRIGAYIVNNLTHASKQPGIIQYWLAHAYAVLTELASFAD
jgi:hypothetical protein